jgi:hypothetical protein
LRLFALVLGIALVVLSVERVDVAHDTGFGLVNPL